MRTRKVVILIALILLTFQGCVKGSVRIHVLLDNTPVSGSEVFVNGEYEGTTNSAGYVQVANLNWRDMITTRLQQYEHPSPRSTRWVMRAYITNVEVDNDGVCRTYFVPTLVPNSDATDYVYHTDATDHYLHLLRDNALIGFKIFVSAEWDMSEEEMTGYGERFKEASEYLFNATDGQFFLEEVDIFDHNTKYVESEYTIFADHTLRPHSTFGGLLATGIENIGFPFTIQLPRKINGNYGSKPPTFIHELGHFGFRLNDEYITGTRSQVCTASDSMGDKNACLMNAESSRRKFCSAHADNPHVGDLIYQNGDCWDAILDMYNDSFTSTNDKWELKSPDTRGVIVGRIYIHAQGSGKMPREWATKVTNHNVKSEDIHAGWHLLERFVMDFIRQDGTPASGYAVALFSTINPSGNTMGGMITIGRTNSDGRITIDGAHQGDIIMLPGNNFGIPPWASSHTTE